MGRAPARVASKHELVGRRLMDRYRVDEPIARGGMSIVFRGYDERLRRPVCIKLFAGIQGSAAAHQTVHAHFVREAYTLSKLRHPNTLQIFDFGQLDDADGTPFQVSELAEGGTVRELVRRDGPLSGRDALGLIEPVAAALTEAHALQIVHRDVKPSNILLCRAGAVTVVKLADFGIARSPRDVDANDETPSQTGEGSAPALYSLNWAAPEQIRGEPGGPEADVYSLGLVMIFLLSGRVVFAGDDVLRLFEDRRQGDALLVERLQALGLPDEIREILLRACRDDPAQRIPTIGALMEALRSAIDVGPTGTPPAPGTSTTTGHTVLTPAVTLEASLPDEIVVGARRIRVVATDSPVEIGRDAGGPAAARLRVTPLIDAQGLHIKGLDCFVAREGGRPSSGLSVHGDTTLALLSPSRRTLGAVRVHFGLFEGNGRVFRLDGAIVALPVAVWPWGIVVDAGPQTPAVLLIGGQGSHERHR